MNIASPALDTTAVSLTPGQEAALAAIRAWLAGDAWCFTLKGFAGSGKSWLVSHLVRTLQSEPGGFGKVAITAPTHKAVAVLRERCHDLDVHCGTIHSLLQLSVRENDDGTLVLQDKRHEDDEHQIGDFRLVIVDECSMLSADLVQIIERKREGARLIFVGDPAQLAPVDGNGEESPTFKAAHQAMLSEIVRQAKDSSIIRMSMVLRDLIACDRLVELEHLAQSIGPDDGGVVSIGGSAFDLALSANQHGIDCRILAFDNASVVAHNLRMHRALHPESLMFAAGERVVMNDRFKSRVLDPDHPHDIKRAREIELQNNTELRIVSCEQRAHPDDPHRDAFYIRAIPIIDGIDQDESQTMPMWVAAHEDNLRQDVTAHFARFREIKRSAQFADPQARRDLEAQAKRESNAGWALRRRYAPLRHTYAMTVHKSQGSGFDAAIIDWRSVRRSRDVFTRNRLLYVAITRAIDYLVISDE